MSLQAVPKSTPKNARRKPGKGGRTIRAVAQPPVGPDVRMGWLVLIFLVASAVLVVKLVHLQFVAPDRYTDWGEQQRLRTIPLEGERGELLDRNGQELALSLPQPVVWADPKLVADPAGQAAQLVEILGVDTFTVQSQLSATGRYERISRTLTVDQAEEIRALRLPGVFVTDEPRRFHPGGNQLLRSVLGFVGDEGTGLSGVELQYNERLGGLPGELVAETAIDGRTIPDGARELQPAIDGTDLQLTIDRDVQFQAERALAAQVEATGARGGVVVIMDPSTGDILAMASLGRTENGDVVSTSDNRAVTWTYDPGSVMKAMTFAAVLEEGLARPNTERSVPYLLKVYDDEFTDTELYDEMLMTPTDILVRSSNTGTIKWADDLTDAVLDRYLRSFGYGEPTALEFPGESAGLFPTLDSWSGTSFATIAIGQGITATPLQTLSAFNVLANDGVYVAPRLVDATVDENGNRHPLDRLPVRSVVSAETAQDLSAMLSRVVSDGTAQRAQVPGYSVAAKTGTARKVHAETGTYEDYLGNYLYVSTVAGYFPAEDPAYSMIVVIDEPTTEIYASKVAAPLFGELAAWTLRHYQVSPPIDVVLQEVELLNAQPVPEPVLVNPTNDIAAPELASTEPKSTEPEPSEPAG